MQSNCSLKTENCREEIVVALPCGYKICKSCIGEVIKQRSSKISIECQCEHSGHSISDLVDLMSVDVLVNYGKELVCEFKSIAVRSVFEEKILAFEFWIKNSESEIDIRIESLKLQIDKFSEKITKKLSNNIDSIQSYEAFYRLVKSLNQPHSQITCANIGSFYKYQPKSRNLEEAIEHGHVDDFEYFLDDENSKTLLPPLHLAIVYEQFHVLNILLQKNVNINSVDPFGNTILFYHWPESNLQVLKYLVSKGLNLNACNSSGNTLLMDGCFHNRKTIVEFLVNNGADVNFVNQNGETALQIGNFAFM